jgi:hypothetical protein
MRRLLVGPLEIDAIALCIGRLICIDRAPDGCTLYRLLERDSTRRATSIDLGECLDKGMAYPWYDLHRSREEGRAGPEVALMVRDHSMPQSSQLEQRLLDNNDPSTLWIDIPEYLFFLALRARLIASVLNPIASDSQAINPGIPPASIRLFSASTSFGLNRLTL